MSALSNNALTKLLTWTIVAVMALIALFVYSPSIGQPPLFDESYLLAWLSNCLKAGLFSSETTAYLLAPAADMRDGLTPFGALYVLIAALLTGTSCGAMRFLQIVLHLLNAALLFYAVTQVVSYETEKVGDEEEEDNAILRLKIRALALIAAFFFLIFPLAPEAVSWLFGLQIQFATTLNLLATVLLLNPGAQNNKAAKITALCLAVAAPLFSLKAALAFTFPLALCVMQNKLDLFKAPELRFKLITLASAALIGCTLAALSLSKPLNLPEAIKQLKIEKIVVEPGPAKSMLEDSPLANLQAITLPVNRKIDERYNKVLRRFYFILPLPILLLVVGLIFSAPLRGLFAGAIFVVALGAMATNSVIDGQNYYGARWLYPSLPAIALLWATLALSPLFIQIGASKNLVVRIVQIIVALVFISCFSYMFIDRTHRQCMSYKSNGKLWKVIQTKIAEAGQKQTSPFLIVRNFLPSLSIAPLLSPFSPQLIDTQSGMPRTASLSAGRLRDALKEGLYTGLTLHYEKQYEGFVDTNIKPIDTTFGPIIDAEQIAAKMTPPLIYYQGSVTLDKENKLLHLISQTKMGPALRMECYGLSPVDGDFLCVEAKIDIAPDSNPKTSAQEQSQPQSPLLELHWLTNWLGDWEARDRKVTTSGTYSDGQFHRYYFPLRTLAWTTSGLPTNLMLGFPRGATVDLKSVGISSGATPLPHISASAVHKQNSNKNYFSHYCFNYPDNEKLGLCAVYGKDNALDITYDVSMIPGAKGALVEMLPLSEVFRNENSQTFAAGNQRVDPSVQKTTAFSQFLTGNIKMHNFRDGGLYSVRIFATDDKQKPIGHASDSLKCLIDPKL